MKTRPLPLAALLAAAFSACQGESAELDIRVDPRIELMAVVQLLAGYELSTPLDIGYRADAEEYFEAYRDHPAVAMFSEMSEAGFTYDVVPKTLLAYTLPPELEPRLSLADGVVARAGGEERLDEFVEQLRQFATTSDFGEFYESQRSFYDSIIGITRLEAHAAVRNLENYLGGEVTNSELILGPLLHQGGFSILYSGTSIPLAVVILGPSGTLQELPYFGNRLRLGRIGWHEFAHTVVDPITSEHNERVEELEGLLDPVAADMRRRGYTSWETVVNEHVVRAIVLRLLHLQFGEEVSQSTLVSDMNLGFAYLPPLVGALEAYEADRVTYPALSDFYGAMLDSLEAGGDQAAQPDSTS